MKKTFKVLLAVLGLGVVMLVILHVVMTRGLTQAMRKVVLPRIQADTGIEARVGRLSIDVPRGMLFLDEVEIRNPEGFLLENFAAVGRVEVEFDVRSLLTREPARVRRVEVEDVVVNVIRDQSGDFNVTKLFEGLPESETSAETETRESAESRKPPVEWILERMWAEATLRYVDFKLNQLDVALKLDVKGAGISTLRAPDAPWAGVTVKGALGNDKNAFMTDLALRMAPFDDPADLSFDLSGSVMEIDTRMVRSAYERLGVRSAPFGVEPKLSCRSNRFESSEVAIVLRDVRMEEKLAGRMGDMGAIREIRFALPIQGSLERPEVDFGAALGAAVRANTGSILEALARGRIEKHAGGDPDATVSDAAVEKLGEEIDELGENEAAMKALKDLADGEPSATNQAAPMSSDTLVEILAEEIDEIGENEALKDELKNLGNWLFGR